MTRREKSEMLSQVVVSVSMPRSEWLLLQTFLVVHDRGTLCAYLENAGRTIGRLRQIKHFVIEAQQRAAEEINAMEEI